MARLKKHLGRKRRIAGWFVLAWAVIFAGLWAASGWWHGQGIKGRWGFGIGNGLIGIRLYQPDALTGEFIIFERFTVTSPSDWRWWYFSIGPGVSYTWHVTFPIWFIPAATTLIGFPTLRSGILARRRACVGLCPKCTYNLAGLPPDSPCPECGK